MEDLDPPPYVDADTVAADPASILQKIDKLVDRDDGARASVWAQGYATACYSKMALFGEHFDAIKALLLKVSEKPLSDTPPAEDPEAPAVKMKDVLYAFLPVLSMLAAMPAPGAPADALAQLLPVCLKVLKNPDLPMTSMMATGPVTTVCMADSAAMLPYLDEVFEVLEAAKDTGNVSADSLLGSVTMLATSAPEVFCRHLDVLLSKLDSVYGGAVINAFWNLSKTHPEAFVPHLSQLVTQLSNPTMFMALYVVGEVVEAFPGEVETHLDGILRTTNVWMSLDHPPVHYAANIFGGVGKHNPGERDRMLAVLGELLATPALKNSDYGGQSVVENMAALCRDRPEDLEGYLEQLRDMKEHGGTNSAASAADAIALYEGNDVAALHNRVDNVQAGAKELNEQLEASAHSLDDVKKWIDANMDQVKEFIGETQKALPTPCRLEITGSDWSLFKKIHLHFRCCRCCSDVACQHPDGNEFRSVTEDWGRWLKMGYSLVTAGECLMDLTSAPIDAVEGSLAAFQEIYDAYNEDPEADFQAYISAPFLGAAERDHLVEQLRSSGFYDAFAYDAQMANWACKTCEAFVASQRPDLEALQGEAQAQAAATTSVTLGLTTAVGNTTGGATQTSTHAKGAFGNLLGLGGGGDHIEADEPLAPLPALTAAATSIEVRDALAEAGVDLGKVLVQSSESHAYAKASPEKELAYTDQTSLFKAFGIDASGGMTADVRLPLIYGFLRDRQYTYEARGAVGDAFMRYNGYPAAVQRLMTGDDGYEQLVTAWAHIGADTFHDGVLASMAMAVLGAYQQDPMGYGQSHPAEMDLICAALAHLAESQPMNVFARDQSIAQAFMGALSDNAFSSLSGYATMGKPKAGLVPVLVTFLRDWKHPGLQSQCVTFLAAIVRTSPQLLEPHTGDIVAAMDGGCGEAVQLLAVAAKRAPATVAPHLPAMLRLAETDVDLTRHVVLVVKAFADTAVEAGLARELLGVTDYCLFVAADDVSGSGYWALGALVPVARAHPATIYPHLLALEAAVQGANLGLHQMYAQILGFCGAVSRGHAAHVVPLAMAPLANPSLDPTDAVAYLAEIRSLCTRVGAGPLEGHVDVIKVWRRSTGMAAEEAEETLRIYEGRDAASLAVRVVNLEDRVNRFNGLVVESCHSFEEVQACLQREIADLKGFMADFAKKLPQPVQFTVEGRVRKSLLLHFVCARCTDGNCRFQASTAFTTVTKEWSKWLKVAFTLLTVGKAVVDAGFGNPLHLVTTGINLVRGVYDAYTAADEGVDFEAYISEPFLTSEETDRLIEQLREADFFSAFVYDADVGDWCCRECAVTTPPAPAVAAKAEGVAIPAASEEIIPEATEVVEPPMPYVGSTMTVPDMPNLAAEAAKHDGSAPPAPLTFRMLGDLEGLEGKNLDPPPPALETALVALGLPQVPDATKAEALFAGDLAAVWHLVFRPSAPISVKAVALERLQYQFFQLSDDTKSAFAAEAGTLSALIARLVEGTGALSPARIAAATSAAELLSFLSLTTTTGDSSQRTLYVLAAVEALVNASERTDAATLPPLSEMLSSLLNPITAVVTKNVRALSLGVPLLFRIVEMTRYPASLRDSAASIISTATYSVPRAVGRHVEDIFALLARGEAEDTLGHVLPQLFKYNRNAYLQPANLQLVTDVCRSKVPIQRISYISVYYNIAKEHGGALVPYLDFLRELLEHAGALGSLLVMTLATVAAASPVRAAEVLTPHLDTLQEKVLALGSMDVFFVNLLCAVGRASPVDARRALPYLFGLLGDEAVAKEAGEAGSRRTQNALLSASILMQVKVLVREDRSLLDPYVDRIRGLLDADAKTAILALELVEFYEGRGIDALATRVNVVAGEVLDLEDKADAAIHARERIEAYIQDHKADLKQFLATVAKKLPVPTHMSVEGTVRKSLYLYFRCCRVEGQCNHGPETELRTETKDWSRWLKFGICLLNVGRHVMAIPDDGLDAVTATYEAVMAASSALGEKEEELIAAYLDEPFLTSAETERLMSQLEASSFFSEFAYDPQQADWVCSACIHNDELKAADGTLVKDSKNKRDDAPDVVGQRFEAVYKEHAASASSASATPVAPAAGGCCVLS